MKKNSFLFKESEKYIPGGVNSPVRAFKAVGGTPVFISKAKGSKIYSVEGKAYIDYVCSWGPLILGHADKMVVNTIRKTAGDGTSFGAPTERELELAKLICESIPSMDLVRFVNSGTEAVMSAIRAARAFTAKDKIIKFNGCYHGHSDSVLSEAGSGLATFGVPSSPGVPLNTVKDTISLPYNDIIAFEKTIRKIHDKIACVIIEPVAGNMGLVLPKEGYLKKIRELTQKYKVVLIFDEVITGFRLSFGGVSGLFGIKPDLTCLGKIIGGGLPVGAYGGKEEIMKLIAPRGPVYQAGTLSGNPLAISAGIATLKKLKVKGFYEDLEKKGKLLEDGVRENLRKLNLGYTYNRLGSMSTLFFTNQVVNDYATAKSSDISVYAQYFNTMLKSGVYLPPSQFEVSFISGAHTYQDIEKTVKINYLALRGLKKK